MGRLDEMFEADHAEGVLLEWPEERRVDHLTFLARKRTENEDCVRALKMVNLAQSWLGGHDLARHEVILRFLEGQNLYMLTKKAAGIAHMRQAIAVEGAQDYLRAEDFLFFAEALFDFGGLSVEKEACQNVSTGIQLGEMPSIPLWDNFLDCSIKRNDIRPIALNVPYLHDVKLLTLIFDRLGRLLIGTPGYTYEDAWVGALNRVLSSSLIDEGKKSYYLDLIKDNRRLLTRLNKRPQNPGL